MIGNFVKVFKKIKNRFYNFSSHLIHTKKDFHAKGMLYIFFTFFDLFQNGDKMDNASIQSNDLNPSTPFMSIAWYPNWAP
jgi:hypothetical protein